MTTCHGFVPFYGGFMSDEDTLTQYEEVQHQALVRLQEAEETALHARSAYAVAKSSADSNSRGEQNADLVWQISRQHYELVDDINTDLIAKFEYLRLQLAERANVLDTRVASCKAWYNILKRRKTERDIRNNAKRIERCANEIDYLTADIKSAKYQVVTSKLLYKRANCQFRTAEKMLALSKENYDKALAEQKVARVAYEAATKDVEALREKIANTTDH